MKENLPQRKRTRLADFDYSTQGAYFITICTEGRKQILCQIHVGADVLDGPPKTEFSLYGKIADDVILQLKDFYDHIKVDQYVIMPNHIHMILFVYGKERPVPTKQHSVVSEFVSTFKRFCNKQYGENIWQRSFNDRIIRNREEYENIQKYIYENPLKWQEDNFYTL